MFLNQLNEKEKLGFLDLAYTLVNADGDFSSNEQHLLNQYVDEMGLNIDIALYERKHDVDTVISEFSESESSIIRMIFIELISLVFVDTNYDDDEKKIIGKYMNAFNISDVDHDKVKTSVLQINEVYKTFSKFIEG